MSRRAASSGFRPPRSPEAGHKSDEDRRGKDRRGKRRLGKHPGRGPSDLPLLVESVFFYLYDVGRSVDLDKVASLLPAHPDFGIAKRLESDGPKLTPLGLVLGSLRIPFGNTAAIIINILLAVIAVLVATNLPIKIRRHEEESDEEDLDEEEPLLVTGEESEEQEKEPEKEERKTSAASKMRVAVMEPNELQSSGAGKKAKAPSFANYVPPTRTFASSPIFTSFPASGNS